MNSAETRATAQGYTYFLIAGEASGDLHAARLIAALKERDPAGRFCAYGGPGMARAGAELLCDYRGISYMGFVPVMLHSATILRAMKRCKRQIAAISPDVVILIDYPGFNLPIAKFVKKHTGIPVFYYIPPKIWAWRESRIKALRCYTDEIFCILPFEKEFYARHGCAVHYTGNPTVDEVEAYKAARPTAGPARGKTIALLAGSRRQEIKDNLRRMCLAAGPFASKGYRLVVAAAPGLPVEEYARCIPPRMIADGSAAVVSGDTYGVLAGATAALVTSGTATLETALLNIPQAVCYRLAAGRLFSFLRRLLLHVPYISLVNLISGREVVKELVAEDMTVGNVRRELEEITENEARRREMREGYRRMAAILGAPGAAAAAAQAMADCLRQRKRGK